MTAKERVGHFGAIIAWWVAEMKMAALLSSRQDVPAVCALRLFCYTVFPFNCFPLLVDCEGMKCQLLLDESKSIMHHHAKWTMSQTAAQ